MSSSEALTDEYLARLLAKDAQDRSIKYSRYGLQSGILTRPTTNAPKPNTRFLKNIIKETDSHNAALKAKEVADARARLRNIDREKEANNRSERSERSQRYPQGQISNKRGLDAELKDNPERQAVLEARRAKRRTRLSRHERRDKRERREHRDYSTPFADDRRRRDCRPQHQRRSRSPASDVSRDQHRKSRRRRTSRSISENSDKARHRRSTQCQDRIPSPSPREYHRRARRRHCSSLSSSERSLTYESRLRDGRSPSPFASDSDPLSSLIPPLPPSPRSQPQHLPRGRGALHGSAAIDSHFALTYDPSRDTSAAELVTVTKSDDWDNALEALRDRERWKASGAERLRAAGFTDEQVGKWERSGDGGEKDVVWKGTGEGREWDIGKVVSGKEGVNVRPVGWGRLKGT
ncbi:MAG: hypothetical protein Q9174_001272 [Haloplaca sp. 1 TL-2023]